MGEKPRDPNLKNELRDDFKYEQLQTDDSIRVLHLRSAKRHEDDLSGVLEDINLEAENIVQFEALSWRWGTQVPSVPLRIHVKAIAYTFLITESLARALKGLRKEREDRTLWIDAICINQDYTEERNRQVAMMNKVYGRAQKVCVWLDDGLPSSEEEAKNDSLAFHFIKNKVLKPWDFDRIREDIDNSQSWIAFMRLMTKAWFSRRWVIQELALAREISVHFGRFEMPWEEFSVAVSVFVEAESATHRLSEVIKKDERYRHIQSLFEDIHTMGATILVDAQSNLFRQAQDGTRKPLSSIEYLVSRFSVFEATQPRDTIYALLAIARDTAPLARGLAAPGIDKEDENAIKKQVQRLLSKNFTIQPYPVDYDKKVIDVYQEFIAFCIYRSNSLNILCRPWAPDPSLMGEFDYSPGGTRRIHKETTRMPSWIADKSKTAFNLMQGQLSGVSIVRMERRNADPLVGLPDEGRNTYNASGYQQAARLEKLTFTRRSEFDQSLFIEGFVLQKEIIQTAGPALLGNIPASWLTLGGWDERLKIAEDMLWKTLVADRGPHGSNPRSYYPMACTSSLRLIGRGAGLNVLDTIKEKQSSLVAQFLRRVHEVIFNRCLFKCQGGSLGLGPNELRSSEGGSRPSDLICILYGCSVPVILRKYPKSEEELKVESDFLENQFEPRLRKAVNLLERKVKFRKFLKECMKQELERNRAGLTEASKGDLAAKRSWKDLLLGTAVKKELFTQALISRLNRLYENGALALNCLLILLQLSGSFLCMLKVSEWLTGERMLLVVIPILLLAFNGQLVRSLWLLCTSRPARRGKIAKMSTPERQNLAESFLSERRPRRTFEQMRKTFECGAINPPKPGLFYYKLIGDCYLHGMMNGEAVELRNERSSDKDCAEKMPNEVFELR